MSAIYRVNLISPRGPSYLVCHLLAPKKLIRPPQHGYTSPSALVLRHTSIAASMAIEVDVSSERASYSNSTFTEEQLVSRTNPIMQFHSWFKQARECDQIPEANAVCLSTCSKDGRPSNRMVLMKTFTDTGFTFFTNYESRKGRELEENPNAAMLFYWPQLHRQVRIEGTVKKLSEKDSTDYFKSRPKETQASAMASCQSRVVSSRDEIVAKQRALLEKYKGEDQVIPKPAHWGGYILSPNVFEFWHGQSNRLHDRIVFTKDADTDVWSIKRLSP